MSKIELVMLICLGLIPIIALVIILPKKLKQHKKAKKEDINLTEKKDNVQKVEEKPIESAEPIKYNNETEDLDPFRKYLSEKKQKSVPERKNPIYETNMPQYYSMHKDKFDFKKNNNKTIKEQFDELTPEMKALIIAGVFDKKDY